MFLALWLACLLVIASSALAQSQLPLLGAGGGSVVAVTHKDGGSASSPTGTTISVTLVGTISSGCLGVGGVTFNNTANLISVTDDKTNTYTLGPFNFDGPISLQTFSLGNITNGPITITANLDASVEKTLVVDVYCGIKNVAAPVDQSAVNVQTNVTAGTDDITSGSVTTGFAGELIYGVTGGAGQPNIATAGTGFTPRQSASLGQNSSFSEDKVQVASGAVSATFSTAVGSLDWLTGIMTFQHQ